MGSATMVSRRRLLAAAGAAAASVSLPLRAAQAAGQSWDLLIIGGGTAGLPAAIATARAGGRVLIVDKAPRLGGTLWFSGGQMSAAGTRLQRQLGIEDSPADHLADIQRLSRDTANPEIAGLAVEHAAETIDWLLDRGLELMEGHPVVGTGHEPYLVRRVYGPPGRGPAILRLLEEALTGSAGAVRTMTSTAAVELIQDRRGRVRGALCRSDGSAPVELHARAVLIASGGHNANPELFEALTGVPLYRAAWVGENTGGGLQLGLSAGGFVQGGEHYLCDFGSIPASLDWPANEFARSVHHPQRRAPWELIVNVEGERFLREDEPSVDLRERALLEQPSQRYWLVFDHAALTRAPTLIHSAPPASGAWDTGRLLGTFASRHPAFRSAASLEALAEACGMPAERLVGTVDDYNTGVARGNDRFGRRHLPRPLGEPPFYAILHQGSSLLSWAGLAVDRTLHVIRTDGSPVAGLYAAGEVLGKGQLSGQCFAGGMMVTPALTFGRLVGERVMAEG